MGKMPRTVDANKLTTSMYHLQQFYSQEIAKPDILDRELNLEAALAYAISLLQRQSQVDASLDIGVKHCKTPLTIAECDQRMVLLKVNLQDVNARIAGREKDISPHKFRGMLHQLSSITKELIFLKECRKRYREQEIEDAKYDLHVNYPDKNKKGQLLHVLINMITTGEVHDLIGADSKNILDEVHKRL